MKRTNMECNAREGHELQFGFCVRTQNEESLDLKVVIHESHRISLPPIDILCALH